MPMQDRRFSSPSHEAHEACDCEEGSMRASISIVVLSALALAVFPAAQTAKTLDVYVIDVEGGNSGLYVSPSGESVLIDSGNGGPAAARDAARIMAAVREAGLKQIDNL